MTSKEPSQLEDRAAIADVLAHYVRAVDRRDWILLRSIYHDDASDDHGDYKGGVDGFVAWLSGRHAAIEKSTHFLGSTLLDFTGPDVCVAETYFTAYMRFGAEAGETVKMLLEGAKPESGTLVDTRINGRYVDRFERRCGAWKIADRVVVYDTMVAASAADALPLKPHWALGERGPDDPSYSGNARRFAGP